MTEPLLVLLSTIVALFMVALLRAGFSPELRAAIRTTLIVGIGWGLAYAHYGLESWSNLSPQLLGMLLVSVMAVVFAWLFHFRTTQIRSDLPGAVTDRVNVVLAVLFATLFLCRSITTQSALLAAILVGGALMLAFGSR